MADSFKEHEIGIHGTCYDIKKYLDLRPKNAEETFFLRVNKILKKIVNHSLRKYTAQKLNDQGSDSQVIINVTLYRSLEGLSAY
ncbi:15814_t:CDS:2 [Entrophospora sp. SA101]|nr:14351_t:CDS:2 [Entrophospora sp. SA101]CAJ0863235.1 15814_t:CDS:2 [Entrophospora sp. SA101]